jgi:hypothetical protein
MLWVWNIGGFVERLSQTKVAQQSVTKNTAMIVLNLVTPKASAKKNLLLKNRPLDSCNGLVKNMKCIIQEPDLTVSVSFLLYFFTLFTFTELLWLELWKFNSYSNLDIVNILPYHVQTEITVVIILKRFCVAFIVVILALFMCFSSKKFYHFSCWIW